MRKIGRKARKRRHLQRAEEVASHWRIPPGYHQTKLKLTYRAPGIARELVTDFSRNNEWGPPGAKK